MKVRRVLVTGATGFIGRQTLMPLVAAGFDVHASARNIGDTEGVTCHVADLLDPAAAGRLIDDIAPTHLLHLAWYAVPGKFWNAPENDSWVRASASLVRAFVAAGGRRVVATGTCAEYEPGAVPCSESSTPINPKTVYGRAKHSFSLLLAGVGISYAWARLFHSYGPHEHPARVVPDVIHSLLQGHPANCTRGDQVRDFLYAGESGAALAALLQSDVTGAVNVASGVPIRLADLIDRIATKIGRPDLVRLGALPDRPDDPPFLVADVMRLRSEVGWTPRVSLDEGLDRTIAWWRSQMKSS